MTDRYEKLQTIKMCVTTYFNLHGVLPSIQEMLEWLGKSYEDILIEQFAA